ncbi:hypothetical protein KBB96_15335 [Luteolibacter ambystomatis]|uniref:Uncharacterized protein n=1 Tax=Luteolibacter ambystomatis TaxID=2824561 RepID=A0A975IYH4_9BACT|nr:hypothetical protein [Luteolibacter ambystomatis]QUE50237.1 hypothetical protein KBB96_15335 [Luteolibacter ambystomatis]
MKRPVVTITDFCLNHAGYFDWLVTGLGLLEQKGELDLRFRLSAAKTALRHRYFRWGAKALAPAWVAKVNGPMWWLQGEIDFGGTVKRFVFDVTDHGYSYAEHLLDDCDLYFKCQLPDSFPDSLKLCRQIERPMPEAAVRNASKIRRAMLGRPLSRSLDFKRNLELLRAWERHAETPRAKRVLAYFGGDSDAEANDRLKDKQGLYQHPNVKRGRIVRHLRAMNRPDVDARLLNSSDPALIGPALRDDDDYAATVASSAWNINVSGLSLSIPFRLIDSFMVGTAVATDSLSIHWYQPFDETELIELGTMGYELDGEVDWPAIEQRLAGLLEISASEDAARRAHVLDRYRRFWSPEALAGHVIGEARRLA